MANLTPWLEQKFFLADGVTPNAGGKVFTYYPGTSTKKATYVSESGSANANPIILDSTGRCNLWLATGGYKIVNAPFTDTDPPAAAIKTWDNINLSGTDSDAPGVVASIAELKTLAEGAFATVQTLGYYSANGIGASLYYWDAASTTADNGVTVISPTISDGTGRWLLINSGALNVTQAGAKGDGVTDDSGAIQAAINAAYTAGGGVVYAPAGNYFIANTAIVLKSNITFKGDGKYATIITTTDPGGGGALNYKMFSAANGQSNIEVYGLRLVGYSNGTTISTYGFVMDCQDFYLHDIAVTIARRAVHVTINAARGRIEKFTISHTNTGAQMDYAVLMQGCTDIVVDGADITGTATSTGSVGKGIVLAISGSTAATYCAIKDSRVRGTQAYGIGVSPDFGSDIAAKDCKITGNIVTDSDTVGSSDLIAHGYSLDWAYRCLVQGNTARNCKNSGLFIGDNPCNGSIVTGNSFTTSSEGIYCSALVAGIIGMNYVNENRKGGLVVRGVNSSEDTRNTIVALNVADGNGTSTVYTAVAEDSNIYYNGRNGVVGLNVAVHGYTHGLAVVNDTRDTVDYLGANVVVGNNVVDNNYNMGAALGHSPTPDDSNVYADTPLFDGIYIETSTRNLIGLNVSNRFLTANLRQRAGLRFYNTNCDDNLAIGNNLDANYLNITDSGARNKVIYNQGDIANIGTLGNLADAAVVSLTQRNGILTVHDITNVRTGRFELRGYANAVIEVEDSTGNFSTVAGTTGINVYYSGGYKLQNLTGIATDFILTFEGNAA